MDKSNTKDSFDIQDNKEYCDYCGKELTEDLKNKKDIWFKLANICSKQCFKLLHVDNPFI